MEVRRQRRGGALVVAFDGVLSSETSHLVRGELSAALDDDAATVVLDVSAVDGVDVVGTAVLVDAARRASSGPGTRLVVAGPTGRLAEALRRARVGELVPFAPDVASALAHAAADPEWLREVADLPRDVSAASRARQVVRDACVRWRVRELSEDATLLASELVTNAVRHAGSAPQLRVELDREQLVVAVSDGDPTPPRAARPDPEASGGRGLRLVDHVASAWGVHPHAGGKTVWCSLRR